MGHVCDTEPVCGLEIVFVGKGIGTRVGVLEGGGWACFSSMHRIWRREIMQA